MQFRRPEYPTGRALSLVAAVLAAALLLLLFNQAGLRFPQTVRFAGPPACRLAATRHAPCLQAQKHTGHPTQMQTVRNEAAAAVNAKKLSASSVTGPAGSCPVCPACPAAADCQYDTGNSNNKHSDVPAAESAHAAVPCVPVNETQAADTTAAGGAAPSQSVASSWRSNPHVAAAANYQAALPARQLQRGIVSHGSTARLRRALNKLLTGQPFTMAFIGGSITWWGCWRFHAACLCLSDFFSGQPASATQSALRLLLHSRHHEPAVLLPEPSLALPHIV